MSRFTQSRGGFAERRPGKSPADLRADWVAGLALAITLAGIAERTEGELPRHGEFGQGCTRLSLTVRDLTGESFPIPAPSVRQMATAFLMAVRAWVHPAMSPETRTACAPFVKAGAACLDGLLSQLRSQEAVSGRRVLGERDED